MKLNSLNRDLLYLCEEFERHIANAETISEKLFGIKNLSEDNNIRSTLMCIELFRLNRYFKAIPERTGNDFLELKINRETEFRSTNNRGITFDVKSFEVLERLVNVPIWIIGVFSPKNCLLIERKIKNKVLQIWEIIPDKLEDHFEKRYVALDKFEKGILKNKPDVMTIPLKDIRNRGVKLFQWNP